MSKPRAFVVVVAATARSLGIGKNGGLPWKLAGDMAYFKQVTSHCPVPGKINAVIMGRKTWLSIPERFRPLQGRCNLVLSRNTCVREDLVLPETVLVADSLLAALDMLCKGEYADKVDQVFVIGGGSVYEEAVALPQCQKILMTTVHSDAFEDCDTRFPGISATQFQWTGTSERHQDGGVEYTFDTFERLGDAGPSPLRPNQATVAASNAALAAANKENVPERSATGKAAGAVNGPDAAAPAPPGQVNEEEMQYLQAVRDIIDHGVKRGDRTGTGTLSKFGMQMRFSLRNDRFPLLTTKRVFWRGVAEELLWFVSGCTDANKLREKDIHIWDGNGSREFLDSLGFHERAEGDLGPVYGFQWRHFGAKYVDKDADYKGQGIDQLAECIRTIKNNPEDRRILLTAWNPWDLKKMALPPCHMFCQFYVANGELSCQMYQRSADMGLGIPFNIASYALLTRVVAQVCGLKAGDFVHTIGDAHVYLNHVDALKEQLQRTPRQFPMLKINPEKTDIDSFEFSDFTVEGYSPLKAIKMQMAV